MSNSGLKAGLVRATKFLFLRGNNYNSARQIRFKNTDNLISVVSLGIFPALFKPFSTDQKEPKMSAVFYFVNDIIKMTKMSIG